MEYQHDQILAGVVSRAYAREQHLHSVPGTLQHGGSVELATVVAVKTLCCGRGIWCGRGGGGSVRSPVTVL